jgi:endoglucanase
MDSILNKKSHTFLAQYLNNPAPTGYEWESQKIWMNYLKPYVDDFITDTYGTAGWCYQPQSKIQSGN